MKSLAFITAFVAVFALAVQGASAKAPERPGKQHHTKQFTLAVEKKQTRKAVQLRPIVLPNIAKLAQKMRLAPRTTLKQQLIASTKVVNFWEHRGKWIRATRHEKCWQVPWQRSCTVARASYKLHGTLAAIADDRLDRWLPYSSDWATAVRIVQRVYPDTESFLLSCSSGEGGHGGFVMNHEGSGASGWMQFMPSTFYGHAPIAFANVRSLGFILPDELTISIESPMAQAVTAAYMRSHGMSSHWDPRIDPLCA